MTTVDARLFPQPADADADVDQGVFEDELVLGAPISRVPAEEAEALPGEIGSDIVLGEIDIVVGGDQGDLRPAARWRPVEALAGMAARLDPRRGGRHAADEFDIQPIRQIARRHASSSLARSIPSFPAEQ